MIWQGALCMRLLPQKRILRQLKPPNTLNVYLFYRNDPKYDCYAVFEYTGGGQILDHIVHNVGERVSRHPPQQKISHIL